MNKLIPITIIVFICACRNQQHPIFENTVYKAANGVRCLDEYCQGGYIGPEFEKGSDVAHQFSNTMSKEVGEKLKELYNAGKYSLVDLNNIKMTTEGMGSGNVTYRLFIPFKIVDNKCEAFTSFDHVGGWNHKPALKRRKKELSGLLMKDEELNISELKKTKEGLQEYWIQWRNKEVQKDCSK